MNGSSYMDRCSFWIVIDFIRNFNFSSFKSRYPAQKLDCISNFPTNSPISEYLWIDYFRKKSLPSSRILLASPRETLEFISVIHAVYAGGFARHFIITVNARFELEISRGGESKARTEEDTYVRTYVTEGSVRETRDRCGFTRGNGLHGGFSIACSNIVTNSTRPPRVSQSSLLSDAELRIELRKVSKGNSKFTRILEEYRGKLRPILPADSPPASR